MTPGIPKQKMCADETDCSYERATMCGWAALGDQSPMGQPVQEHPTSLQFLDCMDSQGHLPMFYNDTAPKTCCNKFTIHCEALPCCEWTDVSKCFNGKQGDQLVAAAQARVKKAFGNQDFQLPNVLVNGVSVCSGEKCDYAAVARHLRRHRSELPSSPVNATETTVEY